MSYWTHSSQQIRIHIGLLGLLRRSKIDVVSHLLHVGYHLLLLRRLDVEILNRPCSSFRLVQKHLQMVVKSYSIILNLFSGQKLAVFKKMAFNQDSIVFNFALIFGESLEVLNGCLSLSDGCLQVLSALAEE